MRLALAPTEEDPEGKGAGGEDPLREVGAVIKKGLRSSRSTNTTCPVYMRHPFPPRGGFRMTETCTGIEVVRAHFAV